MPGEMPDPSVQTGPIAVYGATGYTGRLVAAELHRRGADFVLAGRNQAKLAILAEDLGGARTAAIPLDDDAGLRRLFGQCAAVIACAGPFERHGEPVLAAAADAGAHYLDTTGEQRFMRLVFEDYDERARANGAALLTAMGFDYAPGDLLAAATAEGMGEVDEVLLAYAVLGWDLIGTHATRGTARTAVDALAGDQLEWAEGELRAVRGKIRQGSFEFPRPLGTQRMIRYPSGEHLTVPRHIRTPRVRTLLTAATVMPHARLAGLATVAMAPLELVVRSPLRRVLEAGISRLPEGPSREARERTEIMVVCEVRQGSRRRRGRLTGRDVYGLTAQLIVEAALRCAAPGFEARGALAPAQAFDPREFLLALRQFGVAHEVVPAPEPALR